MKKFAIIIVSFLFLFIFLMLNYLLWDKENLMEQRDSDKIEQDWLRGQNRTLQATVEELEQSIKDLKEQKSAQENRIIDLENRLRLALEKENNNLQEIREKDEALDVYKLFMEEELKDIAVKWFGSLARNKFEESMAYLDEEFMLWGKPYDKEKYIEYISAIENITMQEKKDGDKEPFVILQGQGNPYEIVTRIQVAAAVKESNKESFKDVLNNGVNTLEVVFRYNTDIKNWVIKSVSSVNTGKP